MALAGQRIRSWFELGKPLLKVKLVLSGLQRALRVQSNPFSFLSAEPEEERCQHRVWVETPVKIAHLLRCHPVIACVSSVTALKTATRSHPKTRHDCLLCKVRRECPSCLVRNDCESILSIPMAGRSSRNGRSSLFGDRSAAIEIGAR